MDKDRKIKQLQAVIDRYESGSMKSLCNVTGKNKKRFKIAMRRKFSKFSSTTQLVKYALKQYTGLSFEEFCKLGD